MGLKTLLCRKCRVSVVENNGGRFEVQTTNNGINLRLDRIRSSQARDFIHAVTALCSGGKFDPQFQVKLHQLIRVYLEAPVRPVFRDDTPPVDWREQIDELFSGYDMDPPDRTLSMFESGPPHQEETHQ